MTHRGWAYKNPNFTGKDLRKVKDARNLAPDQPHWGRIFAVLIAVVLAIGAAKGFK